MEIELGSLAKDKITGFKGMVTASSKHLFGCDRYWVQPPVGKDGKAVDGCWFDVDSLEVTKKPVVKKNDKITGGFPSSIK